MRMCSGKAGQEPATEHRPPQQTAGARGQGCRAAACGARRQGKMPVAGACLRGGHRGAEEAAGAVHAVHDAQAAGHARELVRPHGGHHVLACAPATEAGLQLACLASISWCLGGSCGGARLWHEVSQPLKQACSLHAWLASHGVWGGLAGGARLWHGVSQPLKQACALLAGLGQPHCRC